MKILCINDIHLRDQRFSSMLYDYDYNADMFDLMYQAHSVAKMQEVDAIVQLGDLFDVKSPKNTSHNTVQKVIEWAKKAPEPLIGVAGNHDLKYQRLDTLWQGQPLGTVFTSGYLQYYEGWVPGLPLYVVHYQQDWYNDRAEETIDKVFADYRKFYDTHGEYSLVVTHVATFPPDQEPMYEHVKASWLAGKMGNKGAVCYGDIHNSHGVYDCDGVRFCNFGALSRGSLTEDNLNRPVGVTIWDSEDNSFEFIPLKYRPASEIFDVARAVEAKHSRSILDAFFSQVEGAKVEVTDTTRVLELLREREVPSKVVEIIEELLEE